MLFKVLTCAAALCALPAFAQDIGMTIVPSRPLVVYDSPPTGIFEGSNPIAAISGQGNGLVTYDLQQMEGSAALKSVRCRRLIRAGSLSSACRM